MTNKEKRKKLKEEKREKLRFEQTSNIEVSGLLKILLGVILIFGMFYLAVGLYNGEIKLFPKEKPNVEAEVQYAEILMGETFNRPDFEYFVVMYDYKTDFSLYNNLITTYLKKNNEAVLYQVDLNKGFNKPYVVKENSIKNPNNAADLRVLNPTIIKVRNHKAIEYIDTKEEVTKYLSK